MEQKIQEDIEELLKANRELSRKLRKSSFKMTSIRKKLFSLHIIGLTNSEIANDLGVSRQFVHKELKKIKENKKWTGQQEFRL